MKPKVSIIIPTYNRANYIEQTIESALVQDYENYEVIVSDNASTDDTQEVIKKYLKNSKFQYYKNETNLGMVKNWHKALYEYSSGEWFLILSDDDYIIDKSYISKAVKLIKKDKNINIVYANGYMKYEESGEMVPLDLPFDEINEGKKIFLSRGSLQPQDFTLCNILFKKDEALKFDPFENEYNVGCDSELFLFLCLVGKVAVVKDYASVYRIHGNNLGTHVVKSWKMFVNMQEFLTKPYRYALSHKVLTDEELEAFRLKVLVTHYRKILILIRLTYEKDSELKVKEFEEYINNVDNSLLTEIKKDTNFRLKFFLSKYPKFYFGMQKITQSLV